ncbi:MAG: phage baseplate protein, partial [Aggregatibacter sp.]|uniref:phage baseplate protein n=1 Tax=Aggregatibacter sp. TaxID=1872413 RepID=UPI003608DDE6
IKFGGAQLINQFFGNYWGIFDQNGIPLLLADNVKSVKFTNKSKVSDAPVERGSFTSYNKVIEPYTVDVLMTKASGGVLERGAFLGLLDTFANSTDLFMVITPEAIYPNCNIVGYDYSREAGDGARMIKANIHLQEIREVEVQYTTTKTDTASPTKDAGSVSMTGTSSSFDKTSILKKIKDKGLSGVLSEAKDEIVKVFQ